MKSGPCVASSVIVSPASCTCPPGSILKTLHQTDGSSDKFYCDFCSTGNVVNDKGECGRCKNGMAAIPGIFIKEWPKGPIPELFKTRCSGEQCPEVRSSPGAKIPGGCEGV